MKKYCITTYGCQANISDSERMEAALARAGYFLSENEKDADLIIINACSVRQSAVDRVYGRICEIKKKSDAEIIVTGCLLKRDREKISEIARFLDTKSLFRLFVPDNPKNYFSIRPKYRNSFSAYVPVMTGCNNFCSYCAVPYTRGREKSRTFKEILKETKDLISAGYKELWLLGQNVNSYREGRNNFSFLLRTISDIDGNFWIRFTSSHPKDLGADIIETMANSKKITDYLNLPVQSGDSQILKKMNRPYNISDYKRCVGRIRKKIPEIFLSTDVIVGFPGETEKQFHNTVNLFREIEFDMAYISRYSPRPGTPASYFTDNVDPSKKREREKVLNNILQKIIFKKNKALVGKKMDVLVERKRKEYLLGKTRQYKTVKFKGDPALIGSFLRIKITKALPWGLEGEIN